MSRIYDRCGGGVCKVGRNCRVRGRRRCDRRRRCGDAGRVGMGGGGRRRVQPAGVESNGVDAGRSTSSWTTGDVGADAAGGGGLAGGGSGSGSCSVPPASHWRSTMAWFAALVASGMSLPRLFLLCSLSQQLVLCPTVLQQRQEFPSRLHHPACSYAGRGPGSDRFWLLGRSSRSVTCTSYAGSTPAM